MPVAHTCNTSYSKGRHQEDHSSKPVQANSLRDSLSKEKEKRKRQKKKETLSKITNTKKGWWSDSSDCLASVRP
jgi:hypothetical protein